MATNDPRAELFDPHRSIKSTMDDMADQVGSRRFALLEGLAKQFCEATGTHPRDVEIVEEAKDCKFTWHFRRRNEQAEIERLRAENADLREELAARKLAKADRDYWRETAQYWMKRAAPAECCDPESSCDAAPETLTLTVPNTPAVCSCSRPAVDFVLDARSDMMPICEGCKAKRATPHVDSGVKVQRGIKATVSRQITAPVFAWEEDDIDCTGSMDKLTEKLFDGRVGPLPTSDDTPTPGYCEACGGYGGHRLGCPLK